jgi:hypothetical protein
VRGVAVIPADAFVRIQKPDYRSGRSHGSHTRQPPP